MSALHALPGASGHAANTAGSRSASAPAAGEGRLARLAQPENAIPDRTDPGVHASFSPESLRVLEDAALDVAGAAKDWVHEMGQTGSDVIAAAAEAIDAVGNEAADVINASAKAMIKGVDAARVGVGELADAMGDAVSVASQQVGDAVESSVAYAALAVLGGGALLNELA